MLEPTEGVLFEFCDNTRDDPVLIVNVVLLWTFCCCCCCWEFAGLSLLLILSMRRSLCWHNSLTSPPSTAKHCGWSAIAVCLTGTDFSKIFVPSFVSVDNNGQYVCSNATYCLFVPSERTNFRSLFLPEFSYLTKKSEGEKERKYVHSIHK